MSDIFELSASKFKGDPRLKEATRLILESVKDHQKDLKGIRPPSAHFTQNYKETIEAFNRIRGGNLYFPYIGSGWGKGPLVELLDGSVKFDMITGIGPHFWGHSHPELMEIAIQGALEDTIMQGHLQQNQEALLLSKLLVTASGLDHCFLSSSGAMANENALKMIFQKKFPAHRILAFDHCFMGRTLALSQVTDKPNYREGLPETIPVDYIPFYNANDPEGSTQQTLAILAQHLSRYPKQHAVMCFELIQGEGGVYPGTTSYFKQIIDVLKKHEIAVFIDEVQTFGRTSQLFAFQHFDLQEEVDVVSIGKLSQVCATLFRSSFKPKPGLLSQTFTSSTVALKCSVWMIDQLIHGGYYGIDGKLAQLHQRFEEHFKRLESRWPELIQGPYGVGGMIGFTPVGGDAQAVAQFVQTLFQAGVISFVAGSHPTRVRFLIPAGVITFEEVDEVINIMESVLSKWAHPEE